MRLKEGGGKKLRVSSLFGLFVNKLSPEEEYFAVMGEKVGLNH